MNPRAPRERDWTANAEGIFNSSRLFLEAVENVERLIRNSGSSLINGDAAGVARLIVAQLANVHGLAPRELRRSIKKRRP